MHIFGLNFPLKMYFKSIYETKLEKFFPCRAFLWVFDERFIEVTYFHETSPALKYFWLRACYGRIVLKKSCRL